MKKAAAIALILSLPVVTLAANCASVRDDAERLRCYDALNAAPPARGPIAPPSIFLETPSEQSEPDSSKPGWLDLIQLRSSLDPDSEGASIMVRRKDGETSYLLQSAIRLTPGNYLLPESMQRAGWLWELGAAVNKSTLGSEPVDGRVVQLAARGTMFAGSPVTLLSKVAVAKTWDRISEERATGLRFESDVLFREPFQDYGIPHSREGWARFIYPSFGLHADRVASLGETGTVHGGHAALRGTVYPGGAFWPIRLFASAKRARDFGGSAELRRSSTLYRIGVAYAFIDPRFKELEIEPALSLQRTVGSDFLNGIARHATTQLVLTIKLN